MSDAIDKLQDLWFAWDQGSMIGMADTINAIRPALDEMAEARAEIARLTAELAAARAEVDCGQDGPCAKAPGCARHWQERNRELVAELAAARAVTAGVCRYLDCAASDLLAVVTSLYETRARAIREATATPTTVGGLLATAPAGAIVEAKNAIQWVQFRIAGGTEESAWRGWWWANGGEWLEWQPVDNDLDVEGIRQPARLVAAAICDASPESRGPLPKGG